MGGGHDDAKSSERGLRCSFCYRSQREVVKLIAGATVYICSDCARICYRIAMEAPTDEPALSRTEIEEGLEGLGDFIKELRSPANAQCRLCGELLRRKAMIIVHDRDWVCRSCAAVVCERLITNESPWL